MKFSFTLLLMVAFGVMPSFAKVLEDSGSRFVLEDQVLESSVHDCDSPKNVALSHGKFLPENASYLDGNSMPFRYYRVALPTKDLPNVSIENLKTVPLGKILCNDGAQDLDGTFGPATELQFLPVEASTPLFRDGLWITNVRVPLYVKSGSSVALRKSFKLKVEFKGRVAGVNPGKRALARVKNPVAASRFGTSLALSRKALRKASSSQLGDVSFLAKFRVGDKNVATFNEDGLYAVDFKTIRNALLLLQRQNELDGLPIDRICLYGASPDTLADVGPGEAARSPNQIFEIPIEIRDHSPGSSRPDGIFDEGDTLVFVGYGNAFWKRLDREDSSFVNGEMDYFHSYSPYSFYQYFLFGYKESGKGLRLDNQIKMAASSGKKLPWMRYVRAEKDAMLRDTYFGKSASWESATGKEWFWVWNSRYDSTFVGPSVLNTDETMNLPGLIDGGKQYVSVSYFPQRSVAHSHVEREAEQVVDRKMSSRSYEQRMMNINFEFDVNGHSENRSKMTLLPGGNFRFSKPGLQKMGNQYSLKMLPNDQQFDRFDGYTVAYEWTPEVNYAEWLLPGAVSGVIEIPVPAHIRVMKFKNLQPVGFLESSKELAIDSVDLKDDVRYLAVRENQFRSGLSVEGIPSPSDGVLRDLGRPNSKLEYLIISHGDFLEPVKALAEFRSNGSSITSHLTSVVSVDDIYQRYTAGRLSPVAIRNYISYVYSLCPNLQYVLLVGSGHFDYRGMNNRLGPIYMPAFEKEDGAIEDFYAILDSGETVMYGNYDVDVALGRLPVSSVTEMAQYLQKVKDYEKLGVMDYSNWRSTLLLAADDAINSGVDDRMKHTLYQEGNARAVDSLSAAKGNRWNMKKIYLLDYASDAAGQKKAAADDFINILNQGSLFTTYFGHGSKTDWASEGLLKPSYISKLSNKNRYTILGSFSCTVARFDEGNGRSLSEEMLLASGVGAIAAIGASRESYVRQNATFGKNLMVSALTEDNQTIGKALLDTKNEEHSGYTEQRYNNERYLLLGEPVIKIPSNELKVSLSSKLDTISALNKMELSGSVEGIDDGFVDLMIRESRVEKRMSLQVDDDSVDVSYDGALIYSETVPVKNGRFTTEFVTPRKISVGDTAAEFNAWAYSSKVGAVGRSWVRNIVIDGVSDYAEALQDSAPPSIKIQSCYSGGVATGFSDGEFVKLQSPACLQIEIEDSTALDFREQADEGISFEIVGIKEPFHPWPYLEQTSKKAKLRMNFSTEQYPAGKYVFKVRALDVLDNVGIKTLNLEITDGMESGLADVFNVPNPMGKKGTTFYFKNLAVDRDSKVNIFIYNQHGRLVKVIKNAVSGVTHWDGKDNHGRLLANGLYHYVVRSEVSAVENFKKKTFTKKQKLLISR